MNESVFILKGNIVYSQDKEKLRVLEDHYLIGENGLVKGVFANLPAEYEALPVKDYGDV